MAASASPFTALSSGEIGVTGRMLIHPLVTDTAACRTLRPLAAADFVAVDTEFMRENTYWPDLCLIQVACPERSRRHRSQGRSRLKPRCRPAGRQSDVLKVFHAGGQDLEIIYNLTGKTPQPPVRHADRGDGAGAGRTGRLFQPHRIAYARQPRQGRPLHRLGRRPLDKRQIDYAIGDVTHLARLFPKMVDKLRRPAAASGWTRKWSGLPIRPAMPMIPNDLEAAAPAQPQGRCAGPAEGAGALARTGSADKNMPRGRIVKDETLADLAASSAQDPGRSGQGARAVGGLEAGNDIGAAADGRAGSAPAGSATKCRRANRGGRACPRMARWSATC
jgi:ribonuclease D